MLLRGLSLLVLTMFSASAFAGVFTKTTMGCKIVPNPDRNYHFLVVRDDNQGADVYLITDAGKTLDAWVARGFCIATPPQERCEVAIDSEDHWRIYFGGARTEWGFSTPERANEMASLMIKAGMCTR